MCKKTAVFLCWTVECVAIVSGVSIMPCVGTRYRLHCPRCIHAPRRLRRPRRRLPGWARDDAHGALREQIREPAPERRARDDPPAALVSTRTRSLAETATDWRPVSPVERSCGTIGTTAVVSMSSSCSAVLYCRDASSARARVRSGTPTYLADLRGPYLRGRDGEVPVARERLLRRASTGTRTGGRTQGRDAPAPGGTCNGYRTRTSSARRHARG
jgi:hypothetical protein